MNYDMNICANIRIADPTSSNRLITDYKSSLTPSSSYLSDPLMPKIFVHLFGPPLYLGPWIPDWLVITAVLPGVVVDQTLSSVLYYVMISNFR